jgi:plastocyanin
MRRILSLSIMFMLAFTAAACGADAEPGWTYAPATPPPAEAPGETPGNGEPGETPGNGEPGETPGNGEPPANGDVIYISAINIAFEQDTVSAPADTPFVIRFENKEAIPHNVEIRQNGQTVFMGDLFNGPETVDYEVPALEAGTYEFICTVHPNMVGTLEVG